MRRDALDASLIVAALEPLVSAQRRARIDAVIDRRTRSVAVVLDRLFDPHNTAAVMRSADAFGVQEVHLVEGQSPSLAGGERMAKRITTGAERWLDVNTFSNPGACVLGLRERGFEVYVASMDGRMTPEQVGARPKVAMVFGNEHEGVAPEWHDLADGDFAIPMKGFVESLNVSVAAAITLCAATRHRSGDLTASERTALRARFLANSVRDPHLVVAEHLKRAGKVGS